MPADPPFNVYRDQLTSQYHGHALWNPNPPKAIYNHVSIGDVGYVREGGFIRMFNVILPWDHESNRTLGEPEPYESLDCGPFTKILEVPLKTQEHYSPYVSAETNDSNAQAKEPDNAEGVTYKCQGHGALLLLPHGGRRADIIRTKVFKDYIRDHVVSWFTWAQKNQQDIERMENLILVSGCTLVASWAAAAFVYNSMEAKISLAWRTLGNGGECFVWGNTRGAVEYHDSNINPQYPHTTPDQCVFIRGFRAKRVLFWTKPMRAAAEPRPDDPENRRDDEIQVTRFPDGPEYRDPLIGILDYIVEKCPKDAKAEDAIAIAHDDDLRLIKDVEILTADAIEEFLREKQMPLLVENGTAILCDSSGTREVTVERHEGQSQSHTPQFGSLLASRTSQTTAGRHAGRSQQGTRLPSPHRLDKAASMSLHGNMPQPGSQLALVTSRMTAERNEGQLQKEARPPSFHRLAKASALGDRQSPTTQFGSLSASRTSKMFADALADYAQITGIDLSTHPFADKLEQSETLEDIHHLLQEREGAFKKVRNRNRRLIKSVTPWVGVLHTISGTLSEVLSLPAAHFTPAKAVIAGIDVLLATAGKVSSSYDALLDLFESMEDFLECLKVYMTIPPTEMVTDIMIEIMIGLLSVLALATKQIKQGRIKKFVKLLWGKDKIQAALQRLDRLTKHEGLAAGAQTLALVHNLATDETNRMNRVQLIQQWLSPPDSSTNHDSVSKLRHSGTGEWFFKSEALKKWNEVGSLLWIHGKPGAGKSTLLSAIIDDIKRKHAIGLANIAHYYFDFRDPKKQDCYGLLSSLIFQLSVQSDSCCSILSKLYSDNDPVLTPTLIALKTCIMEMLSQPGGPIFMIVDGLDECPKSGTPSARGEVLELIKELIGLQLTNVHLCVASRLETDILTILEPLNPHQISLHDEAGQEADIIAYIKSLIYSNKAQDWTEEDMNLVINTLSQKANGSFRWVACQTVDVLRCYSNDIYRVLDDLPEELDETYGRVLRDIDDQNRKYAHRLFQCLLVSIRPLHVEELATILSVQFDATVPTSSEKRSRPLDAKGLVLVLSTCSSLITIINQGGSQVVQFSHFSVKEFLTSERIKNAEERLSFYHILPEPAHTLLAHASISVLLQLDDKIDRDTIGRFPLAPYAARYWVDHAQYSNVSSHIRELMERLFDPRKSHFAAWVWLYDIDRHWTEPMSTTHPTWPEAGPLYYASLCGFPSLVESLLSVHSSDVKSRGGSHTTPLHAASVKGHFDVASLLLESGADPNSRDNADRVPLHRVSQGRHCVTEESALKIARLLVKFGANTNVADHEGRTPLHAAAHCGYRAIAELLLGSGASPDIRNKNQETPLHLACFNGKLGVSRLLINRRSDVNSRDKNDITPLHSASRYGHVDIARLLLNDGAEVNAREAQQWSPLHQASRYGHIDVARLLIDRGADVNAQKADRWTPLHLASNNGHLDIIELLIDRSAIINSRNDKEETPLDRAAEKGYPNVTRFLIKNGAAVSDTNDKGWTPFHKASYHGHLRTTKILLECGIDINIRNGNGQTSLYLASSSGRLDVVVFLIEQGADIHISDNNSSNPLHIASHNGHLDVVQLLIDNGARIDIRNGSRKTPLALASIKGEVGVGRFLIERGADINALDNRSQAPLHFASRHGHHDMAWLLLGHGVDVNIQRDDLSSPLHLASANGHMEVTELLIQRGAIVDIFNDKQETPLYRAVWNGEVAIASLLIDLGANLGITDRHGGTLLHAASQRGHLRVVKLLLQRGADVNVLNKANQTAAKSASENDQAEVAKFIAEYEVDANIQDEDEEKSSSHGHRGVDKDALNDKGETPYHASLRSRRPEIADLLRKTSVVGTIRPPIKNEITQRSPYRHHTLQRSDDSCNALVGGSNSSLDTIGPPIDHENPQLLPYPSSITLQSNGSPCNASFMTSSSYDSLIEVLNDFAEIHHEDAFAEDTTSIVRESRDPIPRSRTRSAPQAPQSLRSPSPHHPRRRAQSVVRHRRNSRSDSRPTTPEHAESKVRSPTTGYPRSRLLKSTVKQVLTNNPHA